MELTAARHVDTKRGLGGMWPRAIPAHAWNLPQGVWAEGVLNWVQAEGAELVWPVRENCRSFFWFIVEIILDSFPVYQLALVVLLTDSYESEEKKSVFFFKKKK